LELPTSDGWVIHVCGGICKPSDAEPSLVAADDAEDARFVGISELHSLRKVTPLLAETVIKVCDAVKRRVV
jgi:hypothetical protein